MKAVGVFALICIAALSTVNADGTCGIFENNDWGSIGTLKTCFMEYTVIVSKDFSITSERDESVGAFHVNNNKKLEYLPNNLGAKFPGLLVLYARWCSIKEVSKDIFEGIGKLQRLDLHGNQIEKIDDDTFEYIPAVEYIYLWGNKIKKLNGRAFASLHKLMEVDLGYNECINKSFKNPTRIAELPGVVTGKCGFTEFEPSSAKILGGGGTWLICLGFLRLAKKILL